MSVGTCAALPCHGILQASFLSGSAVIPVDLLLVSLRAPIGSLCPSPEGLEDKIENSLYTCMLSALIISPLIFFANEKARLDLPEAVGPAINISFLGNLN